MHTDHARYGFFRADERAFLERMFKDYPDIGKNFDLFLDTPADKRHGLALDVLESMPRKGWVKHHVKDPESVFDHMEALSMMMREVTLPDDLQGLSKGDTRRRLISMATVHDVPEAIVSDFTPSCPIAPEDKTRLELLASRVIFDHNPYAQELIEEYCEQRTPLSHLLHDFDKLAAVFKALEYEGIYPEKRGRLYAEFRDNSVPLLKTQEGRQFAADIEQGAESIRREARQQFLKEKFAGPEL